MTEAQEMINLLIRYTNPLQTDKVLAYNLSREIPTEFKLNGNTFWANIQSVKEIWFYLLFLTVIPSQIV